jgi:hypothetical protein
MRIDADALDVVRVERSGPILAANHPTMLDAMKARACTDRAPGGPAHGLVTREPQKTPR